jgi:ABC-type transporter Mla subunit MlaD
MPGEQMQSSPRGTVPRRWTMVLIVLIGLSTLAALSLRKPPSGPSLRLSACFQDVNNLRPGAMVRLAGVDVGTVRDVRAQPSSKACPAVVVMELRTSYELKIPNDSVVSTATAGILGETYLVIDVSAASGPPIKSGGQLPSKQIVNLTAATVDRALKAVDELKQLSDGEKESRGQSPKSRSYANDLPSLHSPG